MGPERSTPYLSRSGAVLFSLVPASWPGLARFDQSIATQRTSFVPGGAGSGRCVVVSYFTYGYVASDLW